MQPKYNIPGIFIAISTGDRPQKALAVAEAWKAQNINVVAYCWDDETYDLLKEVTPYLFRGERKSFPILQNLMAKLVTGWDCMICGSDDLYPKNVSQLDDTYWRLPGKILWVNDNIHKRCITHPVITRQWYDDHKKIFDERFFHSYCDYDLFILAGRRGEIVKCFNITFEHRHYLITGEPLDALNELVEATKEDDEAKYKAKHKELGFTLGFIPTYAYS